MIEIPIVFSFDSNFALQAGVAINSLLRHAGSNTFYNINILVNENSIKKSDRDRILSLKQYYSNVKISFTNVGNAFKGEFEIRNITIATYYRLLIPKLFPQFDKIIYADVDLIFRDDLSTIYQKPFIANALIAGVKEAYDFELIGSSNSVLDYYKSIGCNSEAYINAGFLILNSKALREEQIFEKIEKHIAKKYISQDQDIINILCKDRIDLLPVTYNYTSTLYTWNASSNLFREKYKDYLCPDIDKKAAVVHFTGSKPWDNFVHRDFLWWNEYLLSPFYNPQYYDKYIQQSRSKLITLRNYIRKLKNKKIEARI